VNDDVPVTVRAPLWVRFPVLSTTVSDPPIVEAARTVATLFVRLIAPAPVGTNVIAPLSALLAFVNVIVAADTESVNDEVPPTVSAPVWVMLPEVPSTIARLPPTDDVPNASALPLVRLALPLAPVVLRETAPVKAFAAVVSVIVALLVDVVNDDVPVMVCTPLCVRLPVLSITTRLPPTLEAANVVATLFVRLALPLAPVVESVTAPVRAFAEVSVIVAFDADVVNDDVPVTVRAPLWVRFPVLSTTVKVPPTVEAPSTNA